MKTVKLWSSTLLRGHKSINLSVLNSNKVAFVMHESQKVASKLFVIRSLIIYHFWSVFITSLWLGQINCVWGSLLVLATKTVFFWITLFFKPKMDLISSIIVFGFLEIQSNNVPVDDKTLPRYILNQTNKTYTCTCLGYEFLFLIKW